MHYPLRWIAVLLLALPLAATSAGAGAGVATGATKAPLDFPMYTLDGQQKWLAEYRGRWVVLNYWATWCPPCLEEIPELSLFHDQHHEDNALVIGINFEKISPTDLTAFLDDHLIDYPMFHQRPRRRTPFGPLPGLPTTYLITPDGVPVAMQSGQVTAKLLEHFIAQYEARHGQTAPNQEPAPAVRPTPDSTTAAGTGGQ